MNLEEFSARKFGLEQYRNRFRTILRKVVQGGRKCPKSVPQKIEICVVFGRHGSVWAGNGSVWIQIGTQPYWTPFGPYLDRYGPVLAHFWIIGLLLGYCWLVPIVALFVQT